VRFTVGNASGGIHLILRQGLLWLSEQRRVFDFVRRNGMARKFASRFVAGETIDEAVRAARELAERGIGASLDLLGESVTVESEAIAARDQYLLMLDRMAAAREQVNVSVKLTQMGLDIAEDLCYANMIRILDKAKVLGGFVRLDMESSEYTQRTLTSSLTVSSAIIGTTAVSSSSPRSGAPSGTSRT
jgi:proline dehydrogenase